MGNVPCQIRGRRCAKRRAVRVTQPAAEDQLMHNTQKRRDVIDFNLFFPEILSKDDKDTLARLRH